MRVRLPKISKQDNDEIENMPLKPKKKSRLVEPQVIKKTAETLERFIGEPVRYTDISVCKEKVAQIRNLFCEDHTSEKQLQDIEIYFAILTNIILNERRAFDDAVKRMHKDISRFSL